jgi:superfamily II DNA or RNA helicase
MSNLVIHAREALYLKRESIPRELREKLLEKYTHRFYEEKACTSCEYYQERMEAKGKHLEICDTCAAYKGGAQLAQEVKQGHNRYLKTPIGDALGVAKELNAYDIEFTVKKHYPQDVMSRPMKFTGTLKDYQRDAVDAIKKKRRGVVKAPPRSGKTVLSTAAICEIGKKTIIMASQRDWLMGFYETFVGSDTQIPLTNCRKSQIGFAKTLADFQKYDVCLVTVQTFYSEAGERLLRKIRDMFPVIVVDEIHTGGAPKYAKVLASLNCEYKIGLSGTPNRKDGRFSLMRALMGPNLYEAKVERLRPHVRLVRTGYVQKSKGQVPWVRMVSSIEKDPKRLKLIAQWAVKDAKAGHMIIIPLAQITPVKALVMAINKLAGKTIAVAFWGGLGKDKDGRKLRDVYIEKARKYKIRVIVGNAKMVSTGINIPRASCLYDVTLSSNHENAEQRYSRILTPWEDKPPAVIRFFLDEMQVRKRCLSNEIYKVLIPKFRPIIQEKDFEALKSYLKSKPFQAQHFEL